MDHATFTTPDLTTFCRLDDLGLTLTGQHFEPELAALLCRPTEPNDWCHRCGCPGQLRDSGVRKLAHVPFGWRPTILQVRLRRYQCTDCGMCGVRTCRARRSRARACHKEHCGERYHLFMSRIATALRVAWNTANEVVLTEGRRVLIDRPAASIMSPSSGSTSMTGGISAAATSTSQWSST